MARREFVYQCGAISKHSLGRLTRTAARFVKVLNLHGVEVSELDALRALDDFYDRFSPKDGVMYTTRFPCHNCAKHIGSAELPTSDGNVQ